MYEIKITEGVPKASQHLIRDVFFLSKGRSLRLNKHFPWIKHKEKVYTVFIDEMRKFNTVATLTIREYSSSSASRLALIGMVCVANSWRGRGLSTQLLSKALAFAAEKKFDSLLLWTSQPHIYSKHGFESDTENSDTFCQVTLNPSGPRACVEFTIMNPNTSLGVPPFGKRLIHFKSEVAELIGVETENGITLAEWTGSMSAVLNLIEAAFPSIWNLNAPANAPIFYEIQKRKHNCTPLPAAIRMVRNMGVPIHTPYISILERI